MRRQLDREQAKKLNYTLDLLTEKNNKTARDLGGD